MVAIELAAARVESFGVRGLATHLDDRFRLLTSGRRSGPPRHRTLRAALDWSYALLSAAEQRVFRRLGVFAGGFTLEAVGALPFVYLGHRRAVRLRAWQAAWPDALRELVAEFKAEVGNQVQNPFVVQQNQKDGSAPIIFPRDAATGTGTGANPKCAK